MCKSIRRSSIFISAPFLIFHDSSRIPSVGRRGCGDSILPFFHFPGGREKELEPFQKAADRRGFPSAGSCFQGGLMDRSGGEKEQQKRQRKRRSSGFEGNGLLSKIFDCFHVLSSLLDGLCGPCFFQKKSRSEGRFSGVFETSVKGRKR